MRTLMSPMVPHAPANGKVRRAVARRVPLWLTLVAIIAVAASACAGDKVAAPGDGPGDHTPATPVGSYALTTVDAMALPWTMFADSGYTLEIQGATLAITADGKWVSKVVQRETVAGFVSTYNDSTFGTWTATASSKTAVLTNAETATTSSATWTATGLTVQQLDGATTHTYAYTRTN
ncbi:MAG TPA: hypothetical protein VG916_14780 [Gemmatimonadaceae bacterium]|nr:hypothetical protein [Gemmatimonadaceae bacterium]